LRTCEGLRFTSVVLVPAIACARAWLLDAHGLLGLNGRHRGMADDGSQGVRKLREVLAVETHFLDRSRADLTAKLRDGAFDVAGFPSKFGVGSATEMGKKSLAS